MATKISSIYTLITADDKPLKRGLVKARQESVKGAKRIQNALNKINFKAIGIGALAMAGSIAFASKKMIDLAIEQERVEKRLGAVIKSTGEAAGYNLDRLKAMAAGMQAVTTAGDETILAGMAILATFKMVRGEAFERTTMAALDLSEVVGTDLNAAMIQLGKALNDPVANLGALSRAGIQFTKQQKLVIKELWTAGRQAEAQSIILDELESQFGGTAKAARETFGGALQSLGNTISDTGEQIGFALMKPLKGVIVDFEKWLAVNHKLTNQDIPGYITKVAGSVVELGRGTANLIRMYDKLPDGVTGAAGVGIIGRVLFGSWAPAKFATAMVLINDQMKKLGMSYGDIKQDIIDLIVLYKKYNAALNEALGIGRQYDEPTVVRKGITGQRKYSRIKDRAAVKRAMSLIEIEAENAITLAAKKHEEQINKINLSYISALSSVRSLRDSWEVMGERTATDEQIDKANQLKNAFESLQSKRINEELEKAFASVEIATEETFDSMIQLSERTAWAMQENFSNVFFDAMTGELKTFGDYAKSILTSIQRAIADITSQMVTQGLFGKDMQGGGWLGNLGSLFGGGSTGSNVSTIRGGQGGGYGFQHGGYIGEPVKGFGMSSGKSYEFHPNEIVSPVGSGGVKVDVNVVNNLGQEADVSQSSNWISPDQMVTDIVLNKKLTSRGFRQSMRA